MLCSLTSVITISSQQGREAPGPAPEGHGSGGGGRPGGEGQGHRGRGRGEGELRPEGGQRDDHLQSGGAPAEVPPDPQLHLGREELNHHLPRPSRRLLELCQELRCSGVWR